MLRQIAFPRNLLPIRGAPPCIKARQPSWKVVHQSQQPAFPYLTDYSSLNLKYVPTYQPQSISKYGWSPKPETSPEYPFFIERTLGSASVPVYTEFLGGRTKVVTLLRRCGGDVETLRDEMSKVCDGKEVRIRTGRLEVDGNYSQRLKRWIIGLGL